MKQPLFSGVCTALVTPFWNGTINLPMVEQLLDRQIKAGIHAVVLAGTTGESATLSDQEKLTLVQRGKEFVGDRCTILAGTGSNSTAHAIALSVAAQEAGADALLVVSPYYNKATPSGLVAHYAAIAQAVEIPIILYNVPSRTGVDMPVPVYRELSTMPNIIGVKEASTDITKITAIRQACGPEFFIWSGNDDMTVPVISLGGQGVISVASNLWPQEVVSMANAALAGDLDTAADLQCGLHQRNKLLFCEVNPIPVKAAMGLLGYDCGPCRLPLTPMQPKNLARLKAVIQK